MGRGIAAPAVIVTDGERHGLQLRGAAVLVYDTGAGDTQAVEIVFKIQFRIGIGLPVALPVCIDIIASGYGCGTGLVIIADYIETLFLKSTLPLWVATLLS